MSSELSVTIKEQGTALYRIAWRILQHAEEVDDVLQDVALEAIRISKSGKQIDSWIGLLKRITVCRSLDQLRKRRTVVAFSEDDFASESTNAIDGMIERELEERLRLALASLPNRQGEVFSLRYFDDCSNQDIALSLEISTAAVATALKKARQRLRELLSVPSKKETL